MEYEFNGEKFTLKADVLGLYKVVSPLIRQRNKLIFEYTKDIDRSAENKYINDIELLKLDIERKTERKENIEAYEHKLKDLQEKFENDSTVKATRQYYNSEIETAMLELLTDRNLLKDCVPKLLEGDVSKLDFGSADIYPLCFKVITDFFLLMTQAKAI